MDITLNYTDQEAKQLFESFGFTVEKNTVLGKVIAHGHSLPDSTELVVINPTTGERILLQNALTRLIRRNLMQNLFWTDKMDALDALNCKSIMHPMRAMQEEVSITK